MRARLLRLLAIRPDPVLLRLLAALAVLAALTAWHEWGMTRLEPEPGAEVLHPLRDGPDGPAPVRLYPGPGRIELGTGSAMLASPAGTGTVALRVTVPPDRPLGGLRVAARLAAEDLKPAADWSSGGHLRLVGRAADGRLLFDRELHLARLAGTRAPYPFRRDVALPSGAVGATLEVELVRASGRLVVSDLVLLPLRERPLFRLARTGLILGWILVGGWTVLRLLGSLRSPLLAGTLGLAATVAIVLLVLPRSPEQRLVGELARLAGLESFDLERLGDIAHVLVFAGLALLATAAVRALSPWAVLLVLALAAPMAEYVQLLTDGRSAEPGDALRNLAGVAIGGGLGLLLRRFPAARTGSGRSPAAFERGRTA